MSETNLMGAVRGLINLAEPNGSNGLGVQYLEKWNENTTFLEFMLTRIRQIKGINHISAIVGPHIDDKVLKTLDFFSIQPIPLPKGHHVQPEQHKHIISSRKWSYQNWAGCPSSYTIFDEVVAMGLVGLFSEWTRPKKLIYFTPEMPFFDPKATEKMIEGLNTNFEDLDFNFLCRPNPMGLSPFLIGDKLQNKLSSTKVWLPSMFLMSTEGKIPIKIRSAMGFEKLDNERRNFTLRSKRDLKRLQTWNGKFNELEELDEVPREIQLEITSTPHDESLRLPTLKQCKDIELDQLESLLDQMNEIDDILLTIGDLGRLESYQNFDELGDLLQKKKPYGVHLIMDANEVFKDLDAFDQWMQRGFDIFTIRLDSLGDNQTYLASQEKHIEALAKKYPKESGHSVLNFEIRKYHDNWKMIHTLQEWIDKYQISFNWPGYNNYAGQIDHGIQLPVYAPRLRGPCQKVLNQMHILPNGDVTQCRQDFSGKNIMGNVFESSLMGVWNGEAFSELRKKTKEDPTGATPLCGGCKHSFFV